MARLHALNSFDDHCYVMLRAVQSVNWAFDDSVETVVLYGTGVEIPANRLHIEQDAAGAAAYGEFQLDAPERAHPRLRVSVKKRLSVVTQGGRRLSRTERYKYQIYFTDKKGRHDRAHVIRFDSADHYGFPTLHHLHIQIDSVRQHRVQPPPAHVGDGFPHLSDIFDIAVAMAFSDGGALVYHGRLLGRFRKITTPERADPALWVPKLADPRFDFLLP